MSRSRPTAPGGRRSSVAVGLPPAPSGARRAEPRKSGAGPDAAELARRRISVGVAQPQRQGGDQWQAPPPRRRSLFEGATEPDAPPPRGGRRQSLSQKAAQVAARRVLKRQSVAEGTENTAGACPEDGPDSPTGALQALCGQELPPLPPPSGSPGLRRGSLAKRRRSSRRLSAAPEKPRCAAGHGTVQSAFAEGGYAQGWICSACGQTGKGERWFCAPCEEDFCFACYPPGQFAPPEPSEYDDDEDWNYDDLEEEEEEGDDVSESASQVMAGAADAAVIDLSRRGLQPAHLMLAAQLIAANPMARRVDFSGNPLRLPQEFACLRDLLSKSRIEWIGLNDTGMPEGQREQLRRLAEGNRERNEQENHSQEREQRAVAWELWSEARTAERSGVISEETEARKEVGAEERGERKAMRGPFRSALHALIKRRQRRERQEARRAGREALDAAEVEARCAAARAFLLALSSLMDGDEGGRRAALTAEQEAERKLLRRRYFAGWTRSRELEGVRLRGERDARAQLEREETQARWLLRGQHPDDKESEQAEAEAQAEQARRASACGPLPAEGEQGGAGGSSSGVHWAGGLQELSALEAAHREWVAVRDEQRMQVVAAEERWRRSVETDCQHSLFQVSELRHITESRRNLMLLGQRREEEHREAVARAAVEEAEAAEWAVLGDVLTVMRAFIALCRRNAAVAQERRRRVRRPPVLTFAAPDRAPARYHLAQPGNVGWLDGEARLRVPGGHLQCDIQMAPGWEQATARLQEKERELWKQQELLSAKIRSVVKRHAAKLGAMAELEGAVGEAERRIHGCVGMQTDDAGATWNQRARPVPPDFWPPVAQLAERKCRIWGGSVTFAIKEPHIGEPGEWSEELWHPYGVAARDGPRRSSLGMLACARLRRYKAPAQHLTVAEPSSPASSCMSSPGSPAEATPLQRGLPSPAELHIELPTDGSFTHAALRELVGDLRYRATWEGLMPPSLDMQPVVRRVSVHLRVRFASVDGQDDPHIRAGRRNIPTGLTEASGDAVLEVIVCPPLMRLPSDSKQFSWHGVAADAERPLCVDLQVREAPYVAKVDGEVSFRAGRPGVTDFDRGYLLVHFTDGRNAGDGLLFRNGAGLRMRADGTVTIRNAPFAKVTEGPVQFGMPTQTTTFNRGPSWCGLPRAASISVYSALSGAGSGPTGGSTTGESPRVGLRSSRGTWFAGGGETEDVAQPVAALRGGYAVSAQFVLSSEAASADAVRRLLERLRFHNSSPDPVLGPRVLRVSLVDSAGFTSSVEVEVQVEAKDEPTELVLPRRTFCFHASPGGPDVPRAPLKMFREAALRDPDTEYFIGGHVAVRLGGGRQRGDGLLLGLPQEPAPEGLSLSLSTEEGRAGQYDVLDAGEPIGTLVLSQGDDSDVPAVPRRRQSNFFGQGSPVGTADDSPTGAAWFAKDSFRYTPHASVAGEGVKLFTVIALRFNYSGDATIRAAQEFLRWIYFVSQQPAPSTATVRTVDVALQVGPAVRKRCVGGGTTAVTGEAPQPWDLQDEIRTSIAIRVTPPTVAVGAKLSTLKYREGSGPQRLTAFEVMHEQYGDSWDGGWVQLDFLSGFAQGTDFLNLREQDGIKVELRDWVEARDGEVDFAMLARMSAPQTQSAAPRAGGQAEWFGGVRSPSNACLGSPVRAPTRGAMGKGASLRRPSPNPRPLQVGAGAPGLQLPPLSMQGDDGRSDAGASEADARQLALLNKMGRALEHTHDVLGESVGRRRASIIEAVEAVRRISSVRTAASVEDFARELSALVVRPPAVAAPAGVGAPAIAPDVESVASTGTSGSRHNSFDLAAAVAATDDECPFSASTAPVEPPAGESCGTPPGFAPGPAASDAPAAVGGPRGSLHALLSNRGGIAPGTAASPSSPGGERRASRSLGGLMAAGLVFGSFTGRPQRRMTRGGAGPRNRCTAVDGMQSISDVHIEGRSVGTLLIDSANGRLVLFFASAPAGDAKGPQVRRRDVMVLLRNLTYLSSAAKADVLQKGVRLLASTSYLAANASRATVSIAVEQVDDVTEILLRDTELSYRCGAPPTCIAPLNSARLWDPDTAHFNGGWLTVEVITGFERGDRVWVLSREEQVERLGPGAQVPPEAARQSSTLSAADGAMPFPGRRGSSVDYVLRHPQRFLYELRDGDRKLVLPDGTTLTITQLRQGGGVRIGFPQRPPRAAPDNAKGLVHIDCVTYLLSCVTFATAVAGGGRKRPKGQSPGRGDGGAQRTLLVRVNDGSNPTDGRQKIYVTVIPPRLQLPQGQHSVPASAGVPFGLVPRVFLAEEAAGAEWTGFQAAAHPQGMCEMHWNLPKQQPQLDQSRVLTKDSQGRVVSADGQVLVAAAQPAADVMHFAAERGRLGGEQLCTLLRSLQLTPKTSAAGRHFEVRLRAAEAAAGPGRPTDAELTVVVRVASLKAAV